MVVDGCAVRAYWRKKNSEKSSNKKTPVKEPLAKEEGITFDIREDYIQLLYENGYKTNEDVLSAGPEEILAIDGIGPATVRDIFGRRG